LEKALDKPALYWVVVNDDFQVGPNSQLKEIGHTQVYLKVLIWSKLGMCKGLIKT
jgi:hypothetical protein